MSGATPERVPLPGEANRGRAVQAMFDRIAPSYDLLNRVMTFRVDQRWRRRLIGALALRDGERLLDLCAGTMDVAAEARRRAPGLAVVGADFSREMLARGAAKTGLPAAQADALALPFASGRFDAATVAFGVRNLERLDQGLSELARVLRPGGRLGVLEFFRPESQGSRFVHGAYNRLALPVLGRVLSPDPEAYRYLVASMERFASRPEFEEACRKAGFREVRGATLFPGVCGLVTAVRA
ncbi:ubiquinone/menaquinone biosynthesis methyltransferase [Anaeromyxobacter diazotrophicus]|uniref:Demethylmenaquinone methyltransferase n=1 Tax=Anaeromyxobacter diazotrophicus TaxID=2590199 RepID=A0A7I9VQV2_9BACT|nr:ubiquinone/menaquinone biosynthesis methyltransferase [Anaeromyxobacter diazotrophicus]GEJ58500.1 demethylmenaquinone methyltransferase [Anaeromyxobacter diazotrophicus]